jgi:hypothetical protein
MRGKNTEDSFCHFVLDPRKYPRNNGHNGKNHKISYSAPNEFSAVCCMGCLGKQPNEYMGRSERASACLKCIPQIDKYYRLGEPFTLNRATGEVNNTEISVISE